MSVFSKIKMSKKAAKEAKGKTIEKNEEIKAEQVKTAYHHVPTHAATDALSGAPSSWKREDREMIKDAHKRRSQMISRTGSSLSTMSNLNASCSSSAYASSHLPRNSSYQSAGPAWFDQGRGHDGYYASEPVQKRQRSSKSQSYHESGIGPSPLASNINSNTHSESMFTPS